MPPITVVVDAFAHGAGRSLVTVLRNRTSYLSQGRVLLYKTSQELGADLHKYKPCTTAELIEDLERPENFELCELLYSLVDKTSAHGRTITEAWERCQTGEGWL